MQSESPKAGKGRHKATPASLWQLAARTSTVTGASWLVYWNRWGGPVPTPVLVLSGAFTPLGMTCSPMRGGTPVSHWLFGCFLAAPALSAEAVQGRPRWGPSLRPGLVRSEGGARSGNVAGKAPRAGMAAPRCARAPLDKANRVPRHPTRRKPPAAARMCIAMAAMT